MERPGWALLGALVPTQFLLFLSPLGPYGAWALVAVALWLCRRDPDMRRGVSWAFAALGLAVVLALVGGGVTVGSGSGPLFEAGSEATQPLSGVGFFGGALGPAAVVLAVSRDATVRGLAKTGALMLGFALLAAVWMVLTNLSRPGGPVVAPMSGTLVLMLLAHAFVLVAFALPLVRGARSWAARRGAAEA